MVAMQTIMLQFLHKHFQLHDRLCETQFDVFFLKFANHPLDALK